MKNTRIVKINTGNLIKIRVLTVIVLLLVSLWHSDARAENRALLVQLGHYDDPTIPILVPKGDRLLDTALMETVMRRVGMTAAQIVRLENETATRDGIEAAITDMRRCRQEDTVYIYFSGLGSRVDGQPALCPYEARRNNGEHDILLADLYRWCEQLPTRRVVLFLDCGFQERRTRSLFSQVKYLSRRDETRQLMAMPKPRHGLVWMACREDEEAHIEQIRRGTWSGLFTFWLVREMLSAEPQISHELLIHSVQTRVATYIAQAYQDRYMQQTPRLLADTPGICALPVFPAQQARPPVATNSQGDTVNGATAHRPTDISSGGTGALQVTPIQTATGTGELEITKTAQLRLRISVPQDLKASFDRTLAGVSGVQIVSVTPNWILNVVPCGEGWTAVLSVVRDSSEEISAFSFTSARVDKLLELLTERLEQLYSIRMILALHNARPAFTVTMETDKQIYRLNDLLKIRLKVNDNRPTYLTLIHVDANSVPRILFPNRWWQETRLDGGKEYTIPSDETGGTFQWRITPPVGRETLYALCTREPLDWKKLLAAFKGTLPPVAVTRGISTEASVVQKLPPSDWAIAVANILILDEHE